MQITDIGALRALYGSPNPRSVLKQLDRIDPHARRFVALSPFVLLAPPAAFACLYPFPVGHPADRTSQAHLLGPDFARFPGLRGLARAAGRISRHCDLVRNRGDGRTGRRV